MQQAATFGKDYSHLLGALGRFIDVASEETPRDESTRWCEMPPVHFAPERRSTASRVTQRAISSLQKKTYSELCVKPNAEPKIKDHPPALCRLNRKENLNDCNYF